MMSESDISLQTLKQPPVMWEDEITSSRVFVGGASLGSSSQSSSSRSRGRLASSASTRAPPPHAAASNLSVRNDSRIFNTINFVGSAAEGASGLGSGGGGISAQSLNLLDGMSTQDQEQLLTEELLKVLTGAGSWVIQVVERSPNQISFTVDPRIENSLKELALQVASLGVSYHDVTKFVEGWSKFEHGQVNQALGAALRDILKDYFILLSQTETLFLKGELSLQKMLFFIHPTLQVMVILKSIVNEIERQDCRGGQVLSLLHEKAMSMVGDATGQNLCYSLAQKASAPYFAILENWIYKGMIRDPFDEFFVLDSDRGDGLKLEVNDNDNYWETRYQLVPGKCPSFLNSVSQEILKAGKYLNVIRQCGKDVCMAASNKISYSIHERVYVGVIEKAYVFASKTLLDLLLNEYDLMRRLKSVKHYLLMDQGDFIVQLLDLTERELNKPADDVNMVRLESLLGLALRTSSSSTDPYKDSVQPQVFPFTIAEQMLQIIAIETPLEHKKFQIPDDEYNFQIPGFEAFCFSYEVQWPISLVLNSRASMCYQLIFRHLFSLKHVERQLCKVWIAKKPFKNANLVQDPEKAATFSLHQRMLNFIQNLQYYMAFEVIEPAWHTFINTLAKVTNVDEVLGCHLDMLNSILEDSMLTCPSLLAKMTALRSLCLQFSDKVLGCSDEIQQLSNFSSLNITIEELTQNFNKELVEFLREVSCIVQNPNQSSKVANIIYRVNFNGFYTDQLEM